MRFTNPFKSRKVSVPRRLWVLILAALFLLVPIVIYFTRYISTQTNYFTNRNFRQLASISRQVEERIGSLQTAIGNAAAQTVQKQSENQAMSAAPSSPGHSFQQLLTDSGLDACDDPPIPQRQDQKASTQIVKPPRVEMKVFTAGETSSLNFSCKVPIPGSEDKGEPITFVAKIGLDAIVNPLVERNNMESIGGPEHEGGFDSILIVSLDENAGKTASSTDKSAPDFTSKTIFQAGTPELDIDSLDSVARIADAD